MGATMNPTWTMIPTCICPEIRNADNHLVQGLTPESIAVTHDCDYVRRRVALIPWASAIADRDVRGDWTLAFTGAMAVLGARLGSIGRVKLDYAECNQRSPEGYLCTLPAAHAQHPEPKHRQHEAWGDRRRVHAWKAA